MSCKTPSFFPSKYLLKWRIFATIVLGLLMVSCSNKKPEKKSIYKSSAAVTQQPKAMPKTPTAIIDLNNVGIGPIESLNFDEEINQEMATTGKGLFGQKCTACHKTNKRYIGPALAGIYERRNPAWVMNILLNPDEMLKKDPIAIKLLEEYNNVLMFNQNLSQEEARALAEYFRTL